jgi:hypothetical protein
MTLSMAERTMIELTEAALKRGDGRFRWGGVSVEEW